MISPWTAFSPEDSERATFAQLEKDHESAVSDKVMRSGVRRLVQESWVRSLSLRLDPSTVAPEHELSANELRDLRSRHPLSSVLPVVHNLLIRHAFDAGLIVAVGDESGRLLWIDGDRVLRRKAEEMMFVEGADWSERRVGTSAPGTALALNHGIQIQRAEHFNRMAHPWSCTAVPIHDPESGVVLGVIDITGGADAVAPQTLPLVEAAVAAIEAELRIQRLGLGADEQGAARVGLALTPTPRRREAPAGLTILGSDNGQLTVGGKTVEISPRHAEILTLLAWHRQGLSADRLALMLSDQANGVDTVRAEMVRVRKVLDTLSPRIVISSRPYRLESPLELDAQRVLAFLERGAHRVALGAYRGAVLPNSLAPGIVELRAEVSARLRESMLSDASPDLLLDYARSEEATYDTEVWRACLELLPPRSPKRATVVARLTRIESELSRMDADLELRETGTHRNLSQRSMP
ncbi:GAF domain-containing protein [Cryobacterium melibiosiphilum]|uniref:GAF domain-containing protein n=1 Tax=Cryobacterium melibiosiphilum TaxID=995039 RepID=A0A3A5MU31_9MICO|nr:GAF domain-containing protein [Cryobacterium melibiosiphilum]RJT89496.1 GAF domain-containing protein [Cryobacterium melibiosiphilum]